MESVLKHVGLQWRENASAGATEATMEEAYLRSMENSTIFKVIPQNILRYEVYPPL
jgi:hypothetical protein